MNILDKLKINHRPSAGALDLLKYIGPGLLVTVGFIDPGNWATNLAAGSEFGYALLWVVTFSSIMLIIIQHNVAHLGIVTGLCLSEATSKYMPRVLSRPILISAMLASISTSLAEVLGGAIALRMLFGMPIKVGAVIVTVVCLGMLLTNTYSKIERWIIMFVSIIGLSFLYELALVDVQWEAAIEGWIKPTFPENSMLIIMSVLGAVVMPHNLFLHSEVIQSREWNLEDESVIKKQLKYEFYDTLLSMVIGWAINSAMIILAAATFFKQNIAVDELDQAQQLLVPLVGNIAFFGPFLRIFNSFSSALISSFESVSYIPPFLNLRALLIPKNIKKILSVDGTRPSEREIIVSYKLDNNSSAAPIFATLTCCGNCSSK